MSDQPLEKCPYCPQSGRGKYWRKNHRCSGRPEPVEPRTKPDWMSDEQFEKLNQPDQE